MKCPICKSISEKWKTKKIRFSDVADDKWEKFKNQTLQIYICKKCPHIFVPKKHSFKHLKDVYDTKGYYTKWEKNEDKNNQLRKISGEIKKRMFLINLRGTLHKPLKKNDVLEIGAALGFFLNEIKNDVKSICGHEISRYGLEQIKKKGIQTTNGDLLTKKFKNKFDMIIMWAVIEHFEDPIRYLKKLRGSLRDGGIIYAQTPSIRSYMAFVRKEKWNIFNTIEHLNNFSPKSLKLAFEKSGFEVLKILPSSREHRLPFFSIFSVFYRQDPGSKRDVFVEGKMEKIQKHPLTNIYRFFCYILGWIFWNTLRINDNITIIARKKDG